VCGLAHLPLNGAWTARSQHAPTLLTQQITLAQGTRMPAEAGAQ
jgi:hypothetical protein